MSSLLERLVTAVPTVGVMSFLANRFSPTTFSIGFLECPLEVACDADRQWRTNMGQWSFRDVSGDLDLLLRRLEPLSGPQTQHIWIATYSEWTAYFDNFINGTDASGCISTMSERIGCRGLLVSCHPNIPGTSYGQSRFDLYGQEPTNTFNCTRSVAATNDSGQWSWDTSGEPLNFESTEAYKNRRIVDRLTPAIVGEYAHALGVDAFNDSFYGNLGCLVTNENINPSRLRRVRQTVMLV